MSDVDRYDPETGYDGAFKYRMDEDAFGEYVKFEEYDRLRTINSNLHEEIACLKAAFETAVASNLRLQAQIAALDWVAMVREVHEATVPEILRDTPGIPEGGLYANYGMGFILEEVSELYLAAARGDLVEMVDALGDIIYVSIRASLMLGVDPRPVMCEIHRAMKTKYEGGLIRREDGKIQKGPNYRPPDVAGVIAAQMKAGGE